MSIELILGWWLLPTFVTVAAFAISWGALRRLLGGEHISSRDAMGAIVWLAYHLIATVASLLAWLIWAVLT